MNASIKTAVLNIIKKINIGVDNEPARIRWLKTTLQKIPDGVRILDAGAGRQPFKELCSHLDYVCQDFGEYDGVGDKKGIQTGDFEYGKLDIVSDIASIPEPDKSFGAILCTEVFEHIPDPELALKEFSRLLKDGGHLVLTAPFCSLTHFAPYHFYSGFNLYYYKHMLQRYGFKIVDIQRNGNFFEYLAQETIRLDNVSRTYTNKGLNIFEKIVAFVFLLILKRKSSNDFGSNELLCHGYHVFAQKMPLAG